MSYNDYFDEKEAKYGNRCNNDDIEDTRTMKELKRDLKQALMRM